MKLVTGRADFDTGDADERGQSWAGSEFFFFL
jgi:hypothetical protein